MITIDRQQKLLVNVSRRLKNKVTAYAIGGTAMMFLGFKEATLDIDLVFANEKERAIFKEAVKSLGYQEMDAVKIYGVKRNTPEMLTLAEERFDLFAVEVIDFIFSETMQARAEQTHQFGDTLILKIADPHDLILMKCATDRLKDKDDARKIINSTKINWEIIIGEAQRQMELGKERAVFDLTCFLESTKFSTQSRTGGVQQRTATSYGGKFWDSKGADPSDRRERASHQPMAGGGRRLFEDLRTMMSVPIPSEIMEKLFALVERQVQEKREKSREMNKGK